MTPFTLIEASNKRIAAMEAKASKARKSADRKAA
jgi:hypothetical protein